MTGLPPPYPIVLQRPFLHQLTVVIVPLKRSVPLPVLEENWVLDRRLRLVIEPGGAVALAAALFRPRDIVGDAVIAVATGGNVDGALYARALQTLEAPGTAA